MAPSTLRRSTFAEFVTVQFVTTSTVSFGPSSGMGIVASVVSAVLLVVDTATAFLATIARAGSPSASTFHCVPSKNSVREP
ncbi:hypothetical protein ASE88_00035 [Sphingomonas sp. Leaf38]|nr:hypothetical protein ASE88_00035 [Sphingomonas sp. Leaf38]